MREVPCGACGGARLRPASLAVTIGDQEHLRRRRAVDPQDRRVPRLARAVRARPHDRRAGGEGGQRAAALPARRRPRLSEPQPVVGHAGRRARRSASASRRQIGSGLVGVLYVLDEPSIGLHQRDNQRLIDTMVRLRDLGNTVIVVEHDEETIRVADHVVDIGPGRGGARRRDRGGGHAQEACSPASARSPASTSPASARSPMPEMPASTRRRLAHRARRATSTTCSTSTSTSRSGASSRSPA